MLDNLAIGPTSLIGDKLNELAPTGVTDRLSEIVISNHALDVQVFQAYRSVVINDMAAKLVVKVSSLIRYLFVSDCNNLTLFSPAVTAFHFATQATLTNLQATFRAFQVLGVVNLFTGRKNGEVLDSKVNTYRIVSLNGFRRLNLALDGHKEFAGLGSRYGQILCGSFHCTVIDTSNPTYFGQVNPACTELEALRIPDRLLVVLALELGIVCPTFKEILVGFLQVHQGLLKYLAISLTEKVFLNFENFRKVGCTIVVVQAAICFFVILFSNVAVMVVHKASIPELTQQFFLLCLIGVDPKLKRFANLHYFACAFASASVTNWSSTSSIVLSRMAASSFSFLRVSS